MIFIETPAFERMREDYLNDDQYRLLQAALMADPESGDLIRGSWFITGSPNVVTCCC